MSLLDAFLLCEKSSDLLNYLIPTITSWSAQKILGMFILFDPMVGGLLFSTLRIRSLLGRLTMFYLEKDLMCYGKV